jgi:hypothetical protein
LSVRSLTFCLSAFCSMVVMLLGCNAGGPERPDAAAQNQPWRSGLSFGVRTPSAVFPEPASRGASWTMPEAKTEDLLYISNAYTVTVYSYPKGKLVGTLRHFLRPLGECSDQTGDVFIANGAGQIFEYAHGGKKPFATLTCLATRPEAAPLTRRRAISPLRGIQIPKVT